MRTTSRRPGLSLGTALGIGAAVVLVLLVVVFRQGAASMLSRATAPLLSMRNALSADEVAMLKAQLASSTAALADRDLLYAENQQLRSALGRVPEGAHEVLAGILQRPPGTPYDTFIIDAAAAQGVAVGDRATVGGVIVGQVDAVYAATARVALYSSPGASYQALLQTKSGSIPVSVEGQGAGSLRAQVPAGTMVSVGDAVVLPGVAGGLTAKVSAVQAPEGESFETLYLHLPFNLFDARWVYIQKQ